MVLFIMIFEEWLVVVFWSFLIVMVVVEGCVVLFGMMRVECFFDEFKCFF